METSDWAKQVNEYQYQYDGRCMYCVECGDEDHDAHNVWASMDLEQAMDAYWHYVEGVGRAEADARYPDISRLIHG